MTVTHYTHLSPSQRWWLRGVDDQITWGKSCAAKAWPGEPIEVFADRGKSAGRDDVQREDFNRLREWVQAGKVRHLWTVEQSRLTRREIEWFEFAAAAVDVFAEAIAGMQSMSTSASAVLVAPRHWGRCRKAKANTSGTVVADPLAPGPTTLHGVLLYPVPVAGAGPGWVIDGTGLADYRRNQVTFDLGYDDDAWSRNVRLARASASAPAEGRHQGSSHVAHRAWAAGALTKVYPGAAGPGAAGLTAWRSRGGSRRPGRGPLRARRPAPESSASSGLRGREGAYPRKATNNR